MKRLMNEEAFKARVTCDECPWRRDVPVGKFPPERFELLRKTVEQGFHALFACHKSPEGQEVACVGFLLSDDSSKNFTVRVAYSRDLIDRDALRAAGPLFPTFDEMARANGAQGKNS